MKARLFFSVFWLLTVVLTQSCVTEFQPDPVSIPPSLIVEGQITDQPGPYTVKLTRTADYSYKSLNLLESGAIMTISDNVGNQETLKELSSGVYATKANGLQGVVGRAYKLSIKTTDGKVYESAPEVLPSAPPIQKIYDEYTVDAGASSLANRQGWNVYIDSKDPDTTGNYYRWSWQHYEPIQVCFQKELPNSSTLTGLDCCSPCWDITRCYTCINVSSDANINGESISRQLILRAPYTSTSRYYVEVEQQALSKGAYAFWKSVKGLVNNTGGLFDAAPATVQGNLRCTNDSSTKVFGFFGATGVAVQFLYVDRTEGQGVPNIPPTVIVPQPSACVICENSLYRTPNKPRWWMN